MEVTPEQLANAMPIATVCNLAYLVSTDGQLGLTIRDTNTTTWKVEEACDLEPGRYFYAGRAWPAFGDCAFAYSANGEGVHTGAANPFDTGGVYWGHMMPLDALSQAERTSRARTLIRRTLFNLRDWRVKFQSFLGAFFLPASDYFEGNFRSRTPEGWVFPDLPAAYQDNLDWRAWTWEIRFHEPHDVTQDLLCWEVSSGTMVELLIRRTQSPPSPNLGPLDMLLTVDPLIANGTFCARLEEEMKRQALS